MHCIFCKSCIIKISSKAGRRNKSNEDHYSSGDNEITADDRSIPWQVNLENCVVMIWLVQASNLHKGKGYSANKLKCFNRAYMLNASQESIFHQFGTGLTFLFKLSKSLHLYSYFNFIPAKQHGDESRENLDS
jgi:hypothetical protein